MLYGFKKGNSAAEATLKFTQFMEKNAWIKELAEVGLQDSEV